MLKIWGRKTSINVQKVLWTCDELGIEFERIDLGGPFGGNNDPAYLKLNPNGLVPTIEDGKAVIWESNTIMRYLCATRNGGTLHPADPLQRSHVERWMDWQMASANRPMATMLFGYYRTAPEKRDPVALEAARKEALRYWQMIEAHLEHNAYLAGDKFTLADMGNGVLAYRWHSFPIERPSLPRVKAWYERLRERPAFKKYVEIPIS
jgi:glutathione S-transferase